jgi:SAM-dependent methyltransferase
VTERFAGDSVVRGDSALTEGVRAELGRCGIQAQNVPTPASDPRELRDHHPAVTDCARASATPHTARFVAVARYLAHRLERRGRPCRVLDYGCGRGDYTLQLADLHRAHRFVGYDAAASRIERASRRGAVAQPRQRGVLHRAPQGTFDVILLNDVLEHTWDVEAFVEALGAEFAHDETLWIGSTPYGARECRSRAPYDEHPMRAHHFERADLVEMLGRWLSFDITYAVASQRHGNHVFRFEGRPHVERIDYERKLQALRPRQSVSLCAILRNASGSVESMLESVRSTVDEVLIGLDRTSTDATAERLLATCRSYRIHRQDLLHRQSARDGLRRRAQCDRGCLRRVLDPVAGRR